MAVQDSAAAGVGAEQGPGGDGGAAARRLLIDGQLVQAERTFPSVNPATGEVFAWAPDATAAHAQASVAAARRAFDTTSWPTDVEFRTRCLNQFYQALVDNKEELRELTITEVGAPRQLTLANQLDVPIEIVRYYADLLLTYPLTEQLPDTQVRGQTHRRWVEKEAAGVVAAGLAVVGGIIAWRFGDLGPYHASVPRFQWRHMGKALRVRSLRLANAGYLGHMWELYAMWTWVPAYLLTAYSPPGGGAAAAGGGERLFGLAPQTAAALAAFAGGD